MFQRYAACNLRVCVYKITKYDMTHSNQSLRSDVVAFLIYSKTT
jgi:hypothetical protein